MAQEFLPLCDVLFNIISLASYFCDVVFDVIMAYTLLAEKKVVWFGLSFGCIMASLIVSQVMSLKWYLKKKKVKNKDVKSTCVIVLHFLQGGVLWRYFKLFIPVELASVKNEVRILCMLRMIHAFCEAAPMLLIQLYLTWLKGNSDQVSDLNIVSTFFSLFSVCWALASFSKNIRRRNIHRLVLTWLGVICQFFWRLGTVSSRVTCLTVYATLYEYWVFAVIFLHWLTMLLWLVSPKNLFHGEGLPLVKKLWYSVLIAYIHTFCYINLHEVNVRQKMTVFYVTMFLENTLLMTVWLSLRTEVQWYHNMAMIIVWGGFLFGLLFIFLYYRFFHIQRLKHTLGIVSECPSCSVGTCPEHQLSFSNSNAYKNSPDLAKTKAENGSPLTNGKMHVNGVSSQTGVFNCRLNPALKRKKKKPSSFVPLTGPGLSTNGKMSNPFWKRSPPKLSGSDHESSVGSRINIQQKLQEKKQQQLQELKEIEEEIKQGKLKRPHPLDISDQGTLRQPIPRSKKQPWLRTEPSVTANLQFQYQSLLGSPGVRTKNKQRSQTPEILLAPHYLDNSCIYYDFQDSRNAYSSTVNMPAFSDISSTSNISAISRDPAKDKTMDTYRMAQEVLEAMYKSYRIPSDIDSQISLPRSYTLPREFRYYRRPRARKTVRTEHFFASNNSSDGDVDSADENDIDLFAHSRSNSHFRTRVYPVVTRGAHQHHETKL